MWVLYKFINFLFIKIDRYPERKEILKKTIQLIKPDIISNYFKKKKYYQTLIILYKIFLI